MTANDAGATAMNEILQHPITRLHHNREPDQPFVPTGNSAGSTITLNSVGSFAGTVISQNLAHQLV